MAAKDNLYFKNKKWEDRELLVNIYGLNCFIRYSELFYIIELIGVINGTSIPSGGRKICDLPTRATPPESTVRIQSTDSRLSLSVQADATIWLYTSQNISSTQSGINCYGIFPLLY